MGRELGQKREKVISKDGDTNYVARCLMLSLLLLIACDITSCSFHSFGLILSSIQHRQWNCSICYEPDTKRLIMARLSVIWNFPVSRGFWQSQDCRCYQQPILTMNTFTYACFLPAAFEHYTLWKYKHGYLQWLQRVALFRTIHMCAQSFSPMYSHFPSHTGSLALWHRGFTLAYTQQIHTWLTADALKPLSVTFRCNALWLKMLCQP